MDEDRKSPGGRLNDRLLSRARRPALYRARMPGGGEYYGGPLASRALKSLGARAMTVDRSVVVGDDFDPSRPESQALYAHEQVHMGGSGGEGTHLARDAEEATARRVERMVLHRAMQHEYVDLLARAESSSGSSGETSGEGSSETSGGSEAEDQRASAERGYEALQKQGLTHEQIVEELAEEFLNTLSDQATADEDRCRDQGKAF